MKSMQTKLLLLGTAVLLAATGCDSDTTDKIMKTAPQHIVYDNGACAYDCAWSPNDCEVAGGAVVDGSCGDFQYCCQIDEEPKAQCDGECVDEWVFNSQGCPEGMAEGDGNCSNIMKVCCSAAEADTNTDEPDTGADPEVCPYQCTYDEWNCLNGDITGLGAAGFPVPELSCSDEMVMQGKTLCCNTVDDPPADPDACPYDCTWDVWNCENGELGANGVALPELNCSAANVRQGRTMCCNTSAVIDTEEDTATVEDTEEDTVVIEDTEEDTVVVEDTEEDTEEPGVCPYACTYDVWNCEFGVFGELGASGIPAPEFTCSADDISVGKTLCCNTDAVDTEIGPDECPYDCTWDVWNCENGELGANGVAIPELNCSPLMVAQGRTMCCNTSSVVDTDEDTEEDTVVIEDTEEDTVVVEDTEEDTEEPGVCPYACTYDVWNCENGDISGLGAVGFPVPELTCSDEMVSQGKTLCCNTVDDPPVDPDACPFDCTWDVWNCENGELGADGIALPELTCSNAMVRQGRTMCCDTTGTTVDTDTEITINECTYECTWDIASCEQGDDLGTPGMALPDLNCSDDYVAEGRTMCCRTDIVVNE